MPSLNPIDNKATAQYLVQAPNVLIYRNGNELFDANGASGKIDLTLDNGAVFNMTKLSVTSTNDTQPNTLSIEFALDTSAMSGYKSAGKDTPSFGVDSPIAHWAPMDHIEVFISPNVEEGRYYRSFMGVITTIDFSINSNIIVYKVEAKDLLYWLENSRINPRMSMFDLSIRNPQLFNKEQIFNVALTKTKYTGLNFKTIIEKMLFDKKNFIKTADGNLPTPEEETGADRSYTGDSGSESTNLGEMDATTLFKGLAGLNPQPGVDPPQSNTEYTQKVYDAQKTYLDQSGKLTKTSPTDPATAQSIYDKQKLLEGKKANGMTAEQAIGSFISSAEDTLAMRATQAANGSNLGVYWENQFLSLLEENYIGMYRRDDITALPIPLTATEAPLMWEGSYDTRLGMLKQMQEWSLYEIYQSHNGFVFVKPPMYNAPPLARIYPVELQSLQRTKNIQNALTSATTEGLLVFEVEEGAPVPEVGLESKEFPFIMGTYKILFPVNFPTTSENAKVDFRGTKKDGSDRPFDYTITNYPQYKKIISNINKTSETNPNYNYSETAFSVTMDTGLEVKDFDVSIPGTRDTMSTLLVYKFLRDNLSPAELSSLDMTVNPRSIVTTVKQQSLGVNSWDNTKVAGPSADEEPQWDLIRSPYAKWFQKLRFYIEDGKRYKLLGCESASPLVALITRISGEIYRISKALYDTSKKRTEDAKRERQIQDFLSKNLFTLVNEAISTGTISANGVTEIKTIDSIGPTAEATRTFGLPSLTMLMKGVFTLNNVQITTGEYNAMQNGYRDIKLTNPMIRTSKQAIAFSKFYLYINNAKVESNAFTLKTLRPDILPGFPILNVFDMCVYYVTAIQMEVVPGEAVTTTVTGIARRRPIYADTLIVNDAMISSFENNPEEFLKVCCFSDSSDLVPNQETFSYNDAFTHTVTPTNADHLKFVGWEMYGPRDMSNVETPGVFCAPFGGHITAQQGNTDTGGKKNTPSVASGKGLILVDTTIFKLGPAQNLTELDNGPKTTVKLEIFAPQDANKQQQVGNGSSVALPSTNRFDSSGSILVAGSGVLTTPYHFVDPTSIYVKSKENTVQLFEHDASGPGRLIVLSIDISDNVVYSSSLEMGRVQYQLSVHKVTAYSPETLRKRLVADFKSTIKNDMAYVDYLVICQEQAIASARAAGIPVAEV